MTQLPNLAHLSHAEKDELIHALWAQVQALTRRVAELETQFGGPPKNPNNSSLPPSKGEKPNLDEKPKREGPRKGSLGRKGGGRALEAHPDKTVIARPVCCAHCQAAFLAANLKLSARYDKIDLPQVKPVVTRVERYAGQCQACGNTTLALLPEGLEPGTPFSINIMTLALYLRLTHAISYKRLTNLMLELFGLTLSEGTLDAMFQRSRTCLDAEVSAILARLRRTRVVYSDETGVRDECIYLNAFETRGELQAGLTGWIGHYNADRPHSKLGGKTPSEVYFAPPSPPLRPSHATDAAAATEAQLAA